MTAAEKMAQALQAALRHLFNHETTSAVQVLVLASAAYEAEQAAAPGDEQEAFEAWSPPGFLVDGKTYDALTRKAWRGFQAGAAWARSVQAPAFEATQAEPHGAESYELAAELLRIADENSIELTDYARWALEEAAELLRVAPQAEQAAAPKAEAVAAGRVSCANECIEPTLRHEYNRAGYCMLCGAAENPAPRPAAPQPPAEREPLTDGQCDKLIADNGLGGRSAVTRAVLIGLCRAAHGIGTQPTVQNKEQGNG